MAEINNTIKTTAELDVTQVEQEIIKLNAKSTDANLKLTERIAAKNKQIELTEKLSKKQIAEQTKLVDKLKKEGANVRDLTRAQDKLNKLKVKAVKNDVLLERQKSKLSKTMSANASAFNKLDAATGGVIGKFNLLLTNPVGAIIAALTAGILLLRKSMGATEDGQAHLNTVFAVFSQIVTSLVASLSDLLLPIMEKVADFMANDLGKIMNVVSLYTDGLKKAFMGFYEVGKLLLVPLRTLVATLEAVALAMQGKFEKAKQVMIDFKNEVVETAKAVAVNFVEAVDSLADAIENTEDAYNDTTVATEGFLAMAQKAAKIEQDQLRLQKDKRAMLLKDAKLAIEARKALAASRDIENLSSDERYAALQKFHNLSVERENRSIAILDREIDLRKRRNDQGKNTEEDENTLLDLQIQREQATERLANRTLIYNRYSKEYYIIEQKREADRKKAILESMELEIERMKMRGADTLELEKEYYQKSRELELTELELTEQEKANINDKWNNANEEADLARREEKKAVELELRAAELEFELQLLGEEGESVLAKKLEILENEKEQELNNLELTADQRIAILQKYAIIEKKIIHDVKEAEKKAVNVAAQEGADALAEAFGLSQELKIAQLTMAAPEAVAESFAKATVYPPPMAQIMGALGAAAVIVPIIKGLNDIKKTRFSKSKGKKGGNAMPAGAPSVANTASVTDLAENNEARVDPGISSKATADAANNVSGSMQTSVVFSEGKYNDFQNQVKFKESKVNV